MRRGLLLICLLLLCAPAAPAQRRESYAAKRARLLRELRKCAPSERGRAHCDENSVIEVSRLYERGDRSVLPRLFDVAPNSDTALAEGLGAFFSDLLCRETETFLRAVSARPRREHEELLFLAAVGDGGGIGCRDTAALRRRLKRLSRGRDRGLARLAAESLKQVDEHNPA